MSLFIQIFEPSRDMEKILDAVFTSVLTGVVAELRLVIFGDNPPCDISIIVWLQEKQYK